MKKIGVLYALILSSMCVIAQESSNLIIRCSNSLTHDEVVMAFRSFGSLDKHQYDSPKVFIEDEEDGPKIPYVYTIKGGVPTTIGAYPSIENVKSLNLVVRVGEAGAGELTIEAREIENFIPGTSVYLEDKDETKMINLREQSEYSFSTDAGVFEERFVLHFEEQISTDLGEDNAAENKIYTRYLNGQLWVYESFSQSAADEVSIQIYDMAGRLVFQSSSYGSGWHHIEKDLHAGIYIIKVRMKDITQTIKTKI
jgi:hypothetical protein